MWRGGEAGRCGAVRHETSFLSVAASAAPSERRPGAARPVGGVRDAKPSPLPRGHADTAKVEGRFWTIDFLPHR